MAAGRWRALVGRRRTLVVGTLIVVMAVAVWGVSTTLGRSPEGDGAARADGHAAEDLTVAAGRLYGRPWSVTAKRRDGDAPCFRLRMSDRSGRLLSPHAECFPFDVSALKAGEWDSMGLDGSRIVLSFGVAAPEVARYDLVFPDATRVRVTPAAYHGVRYFGFAFTTDALAHYVQALVGYDRSGRKVVTADPMDGRGSPHVPRPGALGAPARTLGSGVVDGVAWRVRELPPEPVKTYARAGFADATMDMPPTRTISCEWWTVGGRNDSPECGSWPPTTPLLSNMPVNGSCRRSGVPTICAGPVDPLVDHLILVLSDGRRQTLRLVRFHGHRFVAFAFPTDHPARSLTAYDGQGKALATTDRFAPPY